MGKHNSSRWIPQAKCSQVEKQAQILNNVIHSRKVILVRMSKWLKKYRKHQPKLVTANIAFDLRGGQVLHAMLTENADSEDRKKCLAIGCCVCNFRLGLINKGMFN
jgi:hypothetical protein